MSKRYKPNKKPTVLVEPVVIEPTVKDNLTVSVVKDYLTTRTAQILIAITAIGAILRFYNLSGNSLWLAEASTLGMSTQSLSGIWSTGYLDNNRPFLH